MDSQYDADDGYDDWVLTDVEDGSNIVRQGTEQSVTGDGDQENFDINELEVLSILGELHELDKNMELSHAEMQLKAGLVTAWLKKPLHAWKPQITLRSGYRYSVQLVVQELYHDLVQRKLASMREDTGNEESTKQIGVYQQALTAFMQEDLSKEQLAAAEAIADKWNGMEGPTPEIKSRNAARYRYKYCHNFAEEMWRYCGMQVVCFARWKNVEGTVEACTMDFNRDIVDRTSFNEVRNLEGPWWDYLGEAFEESGISDEDEDGQGDRWPGKKDKNMDNVFRFEKWLDRGGKLQPPAVDSGIPLQIVRDQQSRSHMPATAPTQSKAPAGRTQRSDQQGNGKGSTNTVQPNVQGSDMDDFEWASPVVFEGADMPGPSHDWHGHVSNGGKSSHLKRLHQRKIAADVETDHDDDLLDDGWPQANQRHEVTPFLCKTTAPIQPDDAHQKDTCQVRNKTPFPGRAMKETNTSYVEEEASNSDEVDRLEGLGAADELPTLAKWRPAELIEFTAKIKDGSKHQGDDHL
ncbi:hypothetical protein M404DRAFT_21506 [Pisolithus tinctorius Marx 270]|uniref:Uncharacterized protein n=1 Tax=Pisolithus tinctorius Marx 270 TaxID=870435 RepID=A0A0C3PAF5_PISTI|nr:hypothetical protein M404DRAFT_21506 [Pisolithus tinctorius Marx 270]